MDFSRFLISREERNDRGSQIAIPSDIKWKSPGRGIRGPGI